MDSWFSRNTLWIERVWSIPTSFAFEVETCSNWILSISVYGRYIYEVVPIDWLIGINPRSLPPRNEWILSTRAPSWTIYNPTKNEGFKYNRTNNVESRALSFLDKSKMVDVKIHNRSCPSSRTLLSTTSFQTKFYHNIPQHSSNLEPVWNWFNYGIMNSHWFSCP
jgi:hypothetical protein